MSEISVYDIVPTPKLADKLIGTSVGGVIEDVTYNFTLQELLQLFIPNLPANNLQGVLDYGNTATQNINLTGTISTTNLSVLATANILNSNLSGNTRVMAGLFDRTNASGTAGQFLRSTGTQVEWFTIPTVIPTLQQVLQSGNTSNISIILTANITAVTATASNVVSNTALSVNGVLRDGTAAAGGSNQILSSTGSGVRWVDMPVYNVISPLLYDTPTKTFSIQVANSSQGGYLSSADWINFDGKQDAIILTTSGTSGASTFVGNTLNIPVYSPDLSGYVPTSRTLTINGITYDLSANRSWTIAAGVASVTATSPLFSTGGVNPDISIQKADSSLSGYLSSADWLTFNSKQPAGNYITSLTGEATGAGPGATAVTLSNSAVIAKVLTGLNITGGTVVSTDSILAAFGKVQNQINGLVGGVIYKGIWNAATNTPTLTSSVGTQGNYYIVSVAGNTNLNGITDWQVGDWAIFNGTVWNKVDNTDAVISVNGQTGAVSLTTDNIPEGSTNLYYTNTRARAALSFIAGSGAYNNTTGVITIPTNNNQITNGANYITLASLSAVSPLSYINTTGVFSIQVANTSQSGYLTNIDWNTFNSKQSALTFSSPLVNTAGVISIPVATTSVNGYLSSTDWTTFNSKQTALNGTGFVKIVGTTISYDNSTYYLASNPSAFIALTALSAGVGISYNNTTGVITSTITQYTDALARASVSLTTTGTSGSATYNSTTGVLNIPQYTDQFVGTVTSVAALTLGTTGTDLSSTVANSTTTPVITLNVPTASAANRGALSAADWTTFNSKQNALTNPVTGTITNGQVAYGVSGTNQIAGTSDFTWNNTTKSLQLFGTALANTVGATSTNSLFSVLDGGSSLGLKVLSRRFAATGDHTGIESLIGRVVDVTDFAYIGFRTGNIITFNTSLSTERWRMTSGGNLLINTTTDAGFRLDVNGTGRFSGQLTANSFVPTSSTIPTNGMYLSGTNTLGFATNGTLDMVINEAGSVGIGTSSLTGFNLRVSKNITGATTAYGVMSDGVIQSDVTSAAYYNRSVSSTQAASFTLPSLSHYFASQGTFGAGSTVSNQYGFFAQSSLIGATNNFGFYGDIASGTNRWNLYMNGSANNFLLGSLGIGITTLTGYTLRTSKNITGAATSYGVTSEGAIQSDVTSSARMFWTLPNIPSGSAVTDVYHYITGQGTFTGTATNQYGFFASSGLLNATNNYGFYGNIPSGTNRWNLYMAGTAQNYLAGALSIGVTTANASAQLQIDSTTRGFLPPRMTLAQRAAIASPVNGLIVYQSDTVEGLYIYTSAGWRSLTMV